MGITIEMLPADDGWFHWLHRACQRFFKTRQHLLQGAATCPYCGESDGLLQFLTEGAGSTRSAQTRSGGPMAPEPGAASAREHSCSACHAVMIAYEPVSHCPICGQRHASAE